MRKEESGMLLGSVPCILMLLAGTTAFAAERVDSKNALSDLSTSIRDLTRRVSPAVVEILITGYAAAGEEEGRTSSQISRQRSSGSGVIVDSSGYIVTNQH